MERVHDREHVRRDEGDDDGPVAVNQFTGSLGFNTPFGTIMAAGVIITIPLIILVLFFFSRIIGGLAAGA